MKYKRLELDVIKWAKEKGILDKATPLNQLDKTKEEVDELQEALYFDNNGIDEFQNKKGKLVNTHEEIQDALGDVLVTLIIQAEMQNMDLIDCLESAYGVISKRTGRMENGIFVKD